MSIRAIFFDVDGVLTDGRLYIDERGRELKVFDTKDGHGIKMAIAAGLKVAWISGRTSGATVLRARELGVRALKQGVKDKGAAAREYLSRWKLEPEERPPAATTSPDLRLFDACGSGVPGGRGWVRERADLILKSRGGSGASELVEECPEK